MKKYLANLLHVPVFGSQDRVLKFKGEEQVE